MIIALLICQLVGPLFAQIIILQERNQVGPLQSSIKPLQCNALFNQTHGRMPCKDILEQHSSTCGTGQPFAGNLNNDSICDFGCMVARNDDGEPLKFQIYTGMIDGTLNPDFTLQIYVEYWPVNQHTPYALNVDGVGVDEIMLVRHSGSWTSGDNTLLIVDNNDDLYFFQDHQEITILAMSVPPLSDWCSSTGIIQFGDVDCDGRIDYHCVNNGVDQVLSGLDTSSKEAYNSPDSISCKTYELSNGYMASATCLGSDCFVHSAQLYCNTGFVLYYSQDETEYDLDFNVTLSCDYDYTLKTGNVRYGCKKIPICASISIDNGVVTYHRDSDNSDQYGLVMCAAGFNLAGIDRIVCDLITQQWVAYSDDPTMPSCTIQCPMNGTIENGYFEVVTSNQARITCNHGFKYRGKQLEDASCDSNGLVEWPSLLCTKESFYHVFNTWQNKTVQNKVYFNMESQTNAFNCEDACKSTTNCRSVVYNETTSQCFMYDEFVSRDDMTKEEQSSVSVYSYH